MKTQTHPPGPGAEALALQPPLPAEEAGILAIFREHGLPGLVVHSRSVAANLPVEEVYNSFREHKDEFIAVLDGDRLLGLVARREVGMLLGARYGFALYARKPIRQHLMKTDLRVVEGAEITEVFDRVVARSEENAYDDVVLLGAEGRFLGLISTRQLVRLQHELLEVNIEQLKLKQREINAKNEQIENDLRMARELQAALLSTQWPIFPPDAPLESSVLRFYHRYQPSGTLGGDFFHVHSVAHKTANIFIGDVMGHGVRSALITAMLRALMEELGPVAVDPGEFLTRMNRELRKILRQTGGVLFVTAISMVVDASAGIARYAVAGHPRPVHLRRNNGSWMGLCADTDKAGAALGLFDDTRYGSTVCEVAENDFIVLFTDGLYEVEDLRGEEYGEARLLAAIGERLHQAPEALFDEVLEEVCAFSSTRDFNDDVCLVGVEVRHIG